MILYLKKVYEAEQISPKTIFFKKYFLYPKPNILSFGYS